ncbi:putative RDD family membrane protein YckC [Mucilaginibacter gracilis]|uniref:Putative RDD family membrane protein YckC n=1 Tax=Mucilaginibacter gracilis TaxID=423350 RepID=A0A495JB75_9SPHI|nr:RDD family protein [Mucilaginibacter gracilis]RKR85622.1 putative RDD family membrane protein YckC [Mucilaginibacter gracilis]
MQTVRITTSQNIDIDYQVAGLGDRVAARAIDYMIFLVVYTIMITIMVAFYGPSGIDSSENSAESGRLFIIIIVVWLGLCVFYDLLTEVFLNGQSIGKRSMKIKVISLNGARPGIGQYLLRWLFRIIDFGITLGTAAVVTVAFSDKKQRIGDMVAGTTLVKTSTLTQFKDLVFTPPAEDYEPTYNEAMQLTDQDVVLIHEVIRNFNRTRNSNLVYKLALRIKAHLHVSYPADVNEYEFLEKIVNDYNFLIAKQDI